MSRRSFNVCLLIGFSLTASFDASAQEVVHALSGTVSAINAATKTIIINTSDGSFGLFKEPTKFNVPLLFESDIRSRTTPADTFQDKGAQVIVYYFGGGFGQSSDRTVVALQNLGAGPIERLRRTPAPSSNSTDMR
jgi:hypothetical protein